MRGWSFVDQPENRDYKGWYIYQTQDVEWSCAKYDWTTFEYDTFTTYMPIEKTQAKIKKWIDKNGENETAWIG